MSRVLNTILNGHGAPAADVGIDGDWYIDVDADLLYGPKGGVGGALPGQWVFAGSPVALRIEDIPDPVDGILAKATNNSARTAAHASISSDGYLQAGTAPFPTAGGLRMGQSDRVRWRSLDNDRNVSALRLFGGVGSAANLHDIVAVGNGGVENPDSFEVYTAFGFFVNVNANAGAFAAWSDNVYSPGVASKGTAAMPALYVGQYTGVFPFTADIFGGNDNLLALHARTAAPSNAPLAGIGWIWWDSGTNKAWLRNPAGADFELTGGAAAGAAGDIQVRAASGSGFDIAGFWKAIDNAGTLRASYWDDADGVTLRSNIQVSWGTFNGAESFPDYGFIRLSSGFYTMGGWSFLSIHNGTTTRGLLGMSLGSYFVGDSSGSIPMNLYGSQITINPGASGLTVNGTSKLGGTKVGSLGGRDTGTVNTSGLELEAISINTSGGTVALTSAQASALRLIITGTGGTITAPDHNSAVYFIDASGCSGAVTINDGTAGGVTVAAGKSDIIFHDGTNYRSALTNSTAATKFTSMTFSGRLAASGSPTNAWLSNSVGLVGGSQLYAQGSALGFPVPGAGRLTRIAVDVASGLVGGETLDVTLSNDSGGSNTVTVSAAQMGTVQASAVSQSVAATDRFFLLVHAAALSGDAIVTVTINWEAP